MIRSISAHRARRLAGPERGFTLIELLVVIVILGILAAVVVFAVGGLNDRGEASARAADAKTIRTAQEVFCAQNGRYGSADELVSGRLLSEFPTYNQTDVVPAGTPDANGNCATSGDLARASYILSCDSAQTGCGEGGASALSWQQLPSPLASGWWNDVAFVDHQRGWAVGLAPSFGPGKIISTADGGRTWTEQAYPGFTDDLQGIDCVDATHCWAVGGYSGDILFWDGSSWARQTPPPEAAFSLLVAIDMVSQQRGWAVDDFGKIITTADGGSTWALQHEDPGGTTFKAVHFVDDQYGWVVGNGNVDLRTIDGGLSWIPMVFPAANTNQTDVKFLNRTRGWVVGVGGHIATTVDGGVNWTAQPNASNNQTAVDFVNERQGWSMGAVGPSITTDGGRAWNLQAVPGPVALEGVDFLDAAHGWAVGRANTLYFYGPPLT